MGGTTAKICLIDKAQPQTARALRGGARLPLSQGQRPAAAHSGDRDGRDRRRRRLDRRGSTRSGVSPSGRDSAGSEPGPVCYGRGGTRADRDRCRRGARPDRSGDILRRQDARSMPPAPKRAIAERIGAPLGLAAEHAALGVSEMVDENMANAARVHAIESGKDLRAAHADRVRRRGAAACRARRREARHRPRARSGQCRRRLGGRALARAGRLRDRARPLDAACRASMPRAANRLLAEMRAEAEAVVRRGAPDAELDRAALGLHALSRPGPRDRGRASGARLHRRRSVDHRPNCSRRPIAGSTAARFPASRSKS